MAGFVPPEARMAQDDADFGVGFVPPEARKQKDGPLTKFGKNVVGIGEGALSFGSGLLSAPAMGIRALGEYGFTDADMPTALGRAESSADAITYQPRTDAGKDASDMMSHAYEAGRNFSGDIGGKLASSTGNNEAQYRGLGEMAFDVFGLPLAGKGIHALRDLHGGTGDFNKPIDRSADLHAPEVDVTHKAMTPEEMAAYDKANPDESFTEPDLADNEPGMGFVPPEVGSAGEPVVGDTSGMDMGQPEPEMPQVDPQKTAGYGQNELFAPESPFIPPEAQMAVGPDGVPYRQDLSNEIAQHDYEQAPQGDLFKSREPTLESQLVPEAAQDVIPKGPEGVAPTAPDWTLSPARSKQLELLGHDYEPTTPGEIPRENQREPLSTNTDAGVPFKGQQLKYTGKNAEKRAKALTAEEAAFQEALTKAVGDPFQNDMLGYKHPMAKKQGGVIDPDLLSLGTAKTLEKLGNDAKELMKKFVGTFKKEQIGWAVRNATDPMSRETIVLMSPDEFHQLAKNRDMSFVTGEWMSADTIKRTMEPTREEKRSDIRNALKTPTGLSDIPFLMTEHNGNVLQVLGHEGRHRMDVFKEQGMDLIPVRIRDRGIRWGEADESQIPSKIRGEDGNELPMPARLFNRGPGGKQSGAFDPSEIGKGLSKLFNKKSAKQEKPAEEKKPPLAGPMLDQKRYLTADTRPVEQFIKEEAPHAKEWKDVRGVWDNLFPASNVSTLAAKHPAIKFIVDKALTADREARMAKENAKYGSTFAPKRGLTSKQFNRRVRSDDGALTILEKMPVKESEPAIRLWMDKYDGKNTPMTAESLAADGMNAKQTKMLLAIRDQFDSFLKKYNALAAKYPDRVTPMPVRPNYFPHFWKGDYRVIVRDAKDKSIFTEGVDTKYQAEAVREELQKKFPDHKVEWKEAQTKFDLDNTDAFRQALSILDKDDPARKILQQSFEEILQKRGFRKQTLHREGVPGYLGTKEGKEGVGDAVTAIEMYLDRGYNFLANQQKKAAFSQMLKGLKNAKYDMQKATPNAYDYTSAFIDNSTGGLKNGLHLIDDIVESIGSKTGLGKSLGSNALSGANSLASAFWLTTPRFIAAQLVQPLYNLPKGMELKAVGITDKHVMPTFLKAYQETFFNPSPLTMKGMNWAKENGFIDSKIMDLMGAKFDSHAKTAQTLFQTFSKYSLGKWEQEVVRTPSFIFYDLLLRDAIPNDVQRWTTAGQLTDKYMVDYTKTDSPLAYGKMGILGDAVKPLKQFPHAYFGQMAEYLKDVGSEKTVKPLATFIGVQFLVSGLKGLMLLAEATLLINAWNNVFHTSIQTPDEFLKTHFGKTLTFGPLSTLTGMDMSGTLGAPQIGQMPSLPGTGFAYDAAKNVGQYAVNKVQGLDTEADKMKAIQSVTPNIAQGRVEEAFTKPGEGPPNPNNNMIPNLSPRSFSDKLARDLGGRSVRESSEMMGIRTLKASDAQRKEQRGQILDVMVDHLVEQKGIDKKLINRYVELGGNPENIADSIVLQLKNRTMTYAERYVGNLEGLSGAQKAQRLEQFRLTADQITDPDEMVILMKEIRNAK